MYATDAGITQVILWIWALLERVALEISLTELGEVNICLYALH